MRPPSFAESNGNFIINFEFLFTPGRVMITNEAGLIRRIYTEGRPLAADIRPTKAGTSVGRWEGTTLIVETTGIAPDVPLQRFGLIGNNARITERTRLRQADVLEIEVVTIAPDIYTGTDRRIYLIGRVPGKLTATEISYCNEGDRFCDSATGKERFDMTPPADLLPPPTNSRLQLESLKPTFIPPPKASNACTVTSIGCFIRWAERQSAA